MSKHGPSEAELAAVLIGWLDAHGYDVYQEVELVRQGIRADIVAKRGQEITIIETKTSASLAVLYQAMKRRRYAHRVYVAVPFTKRDFRSLCTELGIGVLHVSTYGTNGDPIVHEEILSRRWNRRPVALAAKLRPEHKTAARAGSQTGGHWSRWRQTCAELARVVAAEPGLAIKEAMSRVQHHYVSGRVASSTMASHVREGRVEGVLLERGTLHPAVHP